MSTLTRGEFYYYYSFFLFKKKGQTDKNNFTLHINRRRKVEFVEEILRMLVVLKPIKCELEIAKGVRAKGEASVTERDVVFNAAEKSSDDESSSFKGAKVISIESVTNQQKSKAKKGADYFALRVSHDSSGGGGGGGGGAIVLRFETEKDRDDISKAIKEQKTKIDVEKASMPSRVEQEARRQLLETNPDLKELFDATVGQGIISEAEFWDARRKKLSSIASHLGLTQKTGLKGEMDADDIGARDGASVERDKIRATLTSEKMHRIFAERPGVRKAFIDNCVKRKELTEREFWHRFLKSEYMKKMRDGGEAQSEAEKNDLILFSRRLEDEAGKRKQVESVSEFVNLQADKDDTLVTGQSAYGVFDRYQGTKEQVKKKVGKGAAGGQATTFVGDDDSLSKMDIARDLNRHGEVVLRGRPKGDDSVATNATTAAMIAEKEDKDALEDRLKKISMASKRLKDGDADRDGDDNVSDDDAEELRLKDLNREEEEPKKMELAVADASAYFRKKKSTETTVAKKSTTKSKQDKTKRKRDEVEIEVKSFAQAIELARSFGKEENEVKDEELDGLAALKTLESITQSLWRHESETTSHISSFDSFSSLEKTEDGDNRQRLLSESEALALKKIAAKVEEYLIHFWRKAPFVTATAWESASKLNDALGELYDAISNLKSALSGEKRNEASRRVRSILRSMDAAFAYYDEEKEIRKASYDAFLKARQQSEATAAGGAK